MQISSILEYDNEDRSKSKSRIAVVGDFHTRDLVLLSLMRKDILRTGENIFFTQEKFVLFFENPDFIGPMFMISCDNEHNQNKEEKEEKEEKQLTEFHSQFPLYLNKAFSCFIPQSNQIILKCEKEYREKKIKDHVIESGKHAFVKFTLPCCTSIILQKTT